MGLWHSLGPQVNASSLRAAPQLGTDGRQELESELWILLCDSGQADLLVRLSVIICEMGQCPLTGTLSVGPPGGWTDTAPRGSQNSAPEAEAGPRTELTAPQNTWVRAGSELGGLPRRRSQDGLPAEA